MKRQRLRPPARQLHAGRDRLRSVRANPGVHDVQGPSIAQQQGILELSVNSALTALSRPYHA